jgi:hypothetical protein
VPKKSEFLGKAPSAAKAGFVSFSYGIAKAMLSLKTECFPTAAFFGTKCPKSTGYRT